MIRREFLGASAAFGAASIWAHATPSGVRFPAICDTSGVLAQQEQGQPLRYGSYLFLPNGPNDRGSRPSDDGVFVPAPQNAYGLWFEAFGQPNKTVDHPAIGGRYRIVVKVANSGVSPTTGLTVDFYEWVTSTSSQKLYKLLDLSLTPDPIIDDGLVSLETLEWRPTGHDGTYSGGQVGSIIVHVYDLTDSTPLSGGLLDVAHDRHLTLRDF